MVAILYKIKADITSRPMISLLILTTITAAAALLTLALATLMNIGAPYDRSFEELNGAHLWLYFDRDRVRQRDIRCIESLPEVVASTGVQYSVTSRVRVGETRVWTSFRLTPLEQPEVNRLLMQEGQYLTRNQIEILASKDMNDLYHLKTGDALEITRWDGKKFEVPIVGLAYNPMWDTYRNSQPPYLYVSENTLRAWFPDESTWEWSIGLRLSDPQAVDEVYRKIEDTLRTDSITGHTDWRDVRESAIFGAQLNSVFLGAFGLFAILATVLVVTTSISSTVLSQFRQIGVLKSIGFTQNQILLLYLGQYLLLGFVGSPLGLLLGIALSPLPLKSVAASLSTSYQPPVNVMLISLVLSIVPGIVFSATLGAAYRGAKANIIRAIATGAEAPKRKVSWSVRLASRLGLPMPTTLGLNDVFAKPFRSFMIGLNLTLGVVGVIFGLALNETLRVYGENPALLGIVYDALVTRDLTSDRQTQGLLRRAPGVGAYYGEYLLDVEAGQDEEFQVRAVSGDVTAFPFRITEGRFFTPGTYEAIAGQGLLDWLGLTIGDTVTLTLRQNDRRTITWTIVGKYPEPVNAGQMMMVDWVTVERWLKPAKPRTYYLKLTPDADTDQLRAYIQPRPDDDLNLVLVGKTLPDAVVYLQLAIFALAAILIGIALVNVFNTSLLAVQEKLKLVGVLKTVGMTPSQVIGMINTTSGTLGFIATLIGIPLGMFFTKGILSTLSKAYGFGQVHVTLNPLYIVLLVPMMVLVSMAGSVLPGRRAAKLSIVKVLRDE